MDNEVASEFIYDNGLYYPAPGNYYGYICTGMEPHSEWDDHSNFLSTEVQDLQFPGLQAENSPFVYYTPNYDYAQSPYNPFNPYIPGAVMGTNGPYIGAQQCFTSSPYLPTISPPGYIPVITQPGSDPLLNGSPDPLLFNSAAVKYAPPLSSMSVTTTPLKVSLQNLSLEPSHSSSHQIQLPGRLSEGAAVNAAPRKKFSPYGDMTSGIAPQIAKGSERLPLGGVSAIRSPLKLPLPANNGFINPVSNVRGWAPVNRMRPRIQYDGVPNRSLGEQNMGPRSNNLKTQLTSPITLKAYTTKVGAGNLDGNIVVHTDQYNRDDFPVDYPDAKFFVIKSYSEDDVHKSIKYNMWSSTSSGNRKLDIAYDEAQKSSVGKQRKCPVFLFFSVNGSGHFCGVAEMIGPVDFHKDMDFWLQDKWTGSFPVKWHIIKDVPNSSFRHIILVNNEYRPVTSSRDTQEVPYLPGISMLTIFKNCPLNTWILDDFLYYEERQRIMQEEKSMLPGRKILETSVSQPIPSQSIKPIVAINHRPNRDEQQPLHAEAGHCLDSDGSKTTPNTADEDLKADIKQEDAEVCHLPSCEGQLNGTVSQPSQSDAHSSTDANPAAEPDGKQINQRLKQSLETTSGDAHATTWRHSATDPKDKRNVRPESSLSSSSSSEAIGSLPISSNKMDEQPDVLTVGSMQIEITDSNSSISGTLTIGSIPIDTKGFKS